MKVKSKKEFTLTVNEEELNALLLGLCRIRQGKWAHNDIIYHAGERERETSLGTVDELIQQLERL